MSSFTLNVKDAVKDFDKYDAKVQKALTENLATQSWVLSGKQRNYLHGKVKANPTGRWTGRIGSTFAAKKRDALNYEIGPGERVAYAWWLEKGLPTSTFKGYHYVRETLKQFAKPFITSIKEIIERPT